MSILIIDEDKCKKCGICAQSCPISIIEGGMNGILPSVALANEPRCLYCGHCESVCPDKALVHQLSEYAMAPISNTKAIVKPDDLSAYMRNRRSIRKYSSKKVDQSTLEQLMDVVRYAPTGTNRQMNQWIVVSDSNLIEQLAAGTIAWMKVVSRVNPELAGKYSLQSIINAYERGIDGICRNAPHLFICYTASSYPAGRIDAVIAASQLELLLPSFGIGACWAGFLMMALTNSPELKSVIGLDDSSTVHAVLMAGYPIFTYFKAPYRNKVEVKWM